MNKKILQHPTIQQHDELHAICKPLNKIGIDYFAHVRIDDKKRFSAISNNHDYHLHYLKNDYYNCDIHMAENNNLGDMIVWDFVHANGDSEKMRREAIAFGTSHLFTMVTEQLNFKDYFHFASSYYDETINQNYISQRGWLEQFNAYFIDKVNSSKSLKTAWEISFTINKNQANFTNTSDTLEHTQTNYPDFCSKKTYTTFNGRYFHLSQRECDMLHWLSLGKSAEDISLICNISPSTVRKHIENIKEKSGTYSLFQLGLLYAQL